MTITIRSVKGSALTHNEVDTNFTDLRDGLNMMVPKTQNAGIKTDSLGTPTFSWHDLKGPLETDPTDVDNAQFGAFLGGIKAHQFAEGQDAYCKFHLPHDYAMGTDLFIHVHWLHNSTLVTGGSVTWVMETTYAKGHNQGAFQTPVLVSVVQSASTTQYQHMIAETALSVSGGSAVQLDTNTIEPDGLIVCRIYLDSNDMTVSSGPVPNPYAIEVDIHYQSTIIGTKNKLPNFWG
jgi:hypothetical protein